MYDGVRPLIYNTKYRRKYYQTSSDRGKIIRYQTPNGQSLLLYPISYLSKATDRTIHCIDSWVRRGVLPQTLFRYKDYKYYSGEQIDLIVRLMKDYNIRFAVLMPEGFRVALKRELSNLFKTYGVYQTLNLDQFAEKYREESAKHKLNMKPLKYKLPTGEVVDLYSIGKLAQKLSREPQVIKKWELSGALPKTPFKTQRKFRLYTQEQIDLISECAESFNIRNGVSIKASGFTEAIQSGYVAIFNRYGLKYK